jgi:hypothetical protein
MKLPLHIVEPALRDDAGHCHSLVRALAGAAEERAEITVWADRRAGSLWRGPGRLQPLFRRRWRHWQSLWLLRRLLREPGRVLIATAGSTSFAIAALAARGRIPPDKLFLFVHWLGAKGSKARWLASIARRQPNLEVLAPTRSVGAFFESCGFRTTVVGYPLEAAAAVDVDASPTPAFRSLLVPGGARLDKGFSAIVDLVAEMQRRGLSVPILVQTSQEAGKAPDAALAAEIARLHHTGYAALSLREAATGPDAWRAMFAGALVVQPYRAADFADRVSGVTLDALAAGAPLVVTEGTWMARLVHRHEAGVATADLSGPGLWRAVETVLARYPHFATNARRASPLVAAEHGAQRLLDAVLRANDG